MQRLTHERNNGIKTGYWSPEKKEELVQRLAAYENTGLTPEQLKQVDKLYLEKCREVEGFRQILKEAYLEIGQDYDVSDLHSDRDKVVSVASAFRNRVLEKI